MVPRRGLYARLVIQQVLSLLRILLRDNHRSLGSEEIDGPLRPEEIYVILKNYEEFPISQEPEQMPPCGSLYLFNKNKAKHFKKDGHNWKKRKDRKRDTEGHSNLKVKGEHKLLCYYTVGEENENFKRRIYSMLEKDLSHIVLVHYLEVKDQESGGGSKNFEVGSSSNRPGLLKDYYSNCSTEELNMRFEELLSSSTTPNCDPTSMAEDSNLSGKINDISSLLINDNGEGDNRLQKRLYAWLLQKMAVGGEGPSVLDKGGQGVLHFGAALGYDWVLLPTIIAGVDVDFCDVNGWTALHWAAHFGRDESVKSLIDLRAQLIRDPIASLTDPTANCPPGATPADLASASGHFKTADYLTEKPWLFYNPCPFMPQQLQRSLL